MITINHQATPGVHQIRYLAELTLINAINKQFLHLVFIRESDSRDTVVRQNYKKTPK